MGVILTVVQYLAQSRTQTINLLGNRLCKQSSPELHSMKMLSETELCAVAIAVALSAKKRKKEQSSRKGRKWAKQWFIDREKHTHETLLNELRVAEPNDFRNFLRMDGVLFDELLALLTPQIEKINTTMRDAIPASQRLSITLRYLATGNTFEDLKFLTAVSPQSIGRIVMETCTALINSLKEYIKVSTLLNFILFGSKNFGIHGKI